MPVTDTLIWAAVVFVPLMTLVLLLAPALRRAIEAVTAAHTVSAAERDAGVQATTVGIAERRHKLAISQALLPEETEAERARLAAETAQYDTDREAWGKVLDTAVATRREVLAARAEAEAELAPEAARAALKDSGEDMGALAQAYAAYCQGCPGSVAPYGFGDWLGDFEGLGR
jgi:hypothetical protein